MPHSVPASFASSLRSFAASWTASLAASLRYGLRQMLRRPGESATAVVVLALGLGLAGSGWAVVWGTYLRPVPVPDDERLARVALADAEASDGLANPGWERFRALRDELERLTTVERLEAWAPLGFNVAGLPGPGTRARGAAVTHGLLDLAGAVPVEGRLLTAEDERREARVVVASESFWRDHLDARPVASGDLTVRIYGEEYQVVGVLPPGVRFPYRQDLWMPARGDFMDVPWMQVLAKVRPDIGFEAARNELDAAVAHAGSLESPSREASPAEEALELSGSAGPVVLERLRDTYFDERMRSGVMAAAGAALAILLLACANVANLLLARGLRRRREMAVRTSLGARRHQLVGQLLVETSLLAAVGGAVGIGLCHLCLRLWNVYTEGIGVPYWVAVRIDPQVLAATAALVLASTVVAGLVPAWRQSSVSVVPGTGHGAGRGHDGRSRADRLLVVAQVAGSVALLATCAVLVRTVERMESERAYLERPDVVTAQLSLIDKTLDRSVERAPLWDRILRRLEEMPEVARVAVVTRLPTDGAGSDGKAETADGRTLGIRYGVASPGAFDMLGAVLLAGRDVSPGDDHGSQPVALVDQDLARRLFPGLPLDQVVGQTLRAGHDSENFPKFPMRTIVGVVEDLGAANLPAADLGSTGAGDGDSERNVPQAYLPLHQMNLTGGDLLLELRAGAAGSGPGLARRLALAVDEVAPGHPVYEVRTLEEQLHKITRVEASARAAFSVLAVVALVLAAAGLYGVLAVSVGRRRRELAVRTALGATPGDLLRRVLGSGLGLVATGCAAGLLLAFWSTRAVESLLHGVEPWDPAALGGAVAVLATAGLVAAWIPARRAARVEPATALREE